MPSDAKKKRDLQKKTAAKQRQSQRTTKSNATNVDDDDLIDDNEDEEAQNENDNPGTPKNETSTDAVVDPNIKAVIQNLDLLSMVEKANADARASTGKRSVARWIRRSDWLF